MINRRNFSSMAMLSLALSPACSYSEKAGAAAVVLPDVQRDVAQRLRAIERDSRGRLGVHILDTASGATFGHRPDERFPMCSTFKLLASALVLRRVDLGQESLERRIPFGAGDLVAASPVTEKHASGAGMTLGELCEATLTTSDNTAANLILASYGGPARLTAYARELGDTVTRLDRIEPALNDWRAGDLRDTTSPRAMLGSLQKVAFGEALSAASRETLQRWLLSNTTGDRRLKAGLPAGWRIGDKTGTSDPGTSNDIGIVWPPQRAPLLVTAYLTGAGAPSAARDDTLAKVGALLPLIAAA